MVVRMRHNRSQVRQRRSHHALTATTLVACTHCDALRRPHHMCLACGYYKGRMVIDLAKVGSKRSERIRTKKESIRAESGTKTETAAIEAPKKVDKKAKKAKEDVA